MAFRELSTKRFTGFFNYDPGNCIEGTIEEESITGKNDQGQEVGYIAVKISKPCKAKIEDKECDAQPGSIIAFSITNATRVLLGLNHSVPVRCTFIEFRQNKRNPTNKYHCWKIEVDDGKEDAA